jgi:hypothetical protein
VSLWALRIGVIALATTHSRPPVYHVRRYSHRRSHPTFPRQHNSSPTRPAKAASCAQGAGEPAYPASSTRRITSPPAHPTQGARRHRDCFPRGGLSPSRRGPVCGLNEPFCARSLRAQRPRNIGPLRHPERLPVRAIGRLNPSPVKLRGRQPRGLLFGSSGRLRSALPTWESRHAALRAAPVRRSGVTGAGPCLVERIGSAYEVTCCRRAIVR